jgi:acyl carrier protein
MVPTLSKSLRPRRWTFIERGHFETVFGWRYRRLSMDVEATIKQYITNEFLKGKKREIGPDESLIGSGVLDSLTLLQLISFVEEQFGVTVSDSEMIPDNFQSINGIKAFLEGKTQNS